MSPQSPGTHTHTQPAPAPTGHLAIPLTVALQGFSTGPWAVSLSFEDWISRDGGRMLWGEQGCNHLSPSSPWMPWLMSQPLCPIGLLSQPHLSALLMTLGWARDSVSCHSISGSGGGGRGGVPGQGRGTPFPSPICGHLLPAQSCRSFRPTRGPRRVWGAAGHTAARAACPGPVSSAGTPHPAPGGSGPVPCPLVPLPGCWTGLTLRPALSLPLPERPPPGWGEPTAGQGHHKRLSHLARPALP